MTTETKPVDTTTTGEKPAKSPAATPSQARDGQQAPDAASATPESLEGQGERPPFGPCVACGAMSNERPCPNTPDGNHHVNVIPARTIHERMVAILAELPAIGKTSENMQQKFMYRSHDDVLNALNPLLAKHGVYVVPEVLERVTAQRTTKSGSTMYEVNLHVRYCFIAAGGDWIAASAWGEGTDSGDKATNKAMTMAMKNVLAQSFAISTADTIDADGGTPEETTGEQQTAAKADRMRARIAALCVSLDEKTKAEPGTFLRLTEEGAIAGFSIAAPGDDPLSKLGEDDLAEIGKTLVVKLESEMTEAPEQLDFTVPMF